MIPFFAIASISETLGIMTIMPLIAVITNQQEIPMISLLIEFLQVMWPETDATLIVFGIFISGIFLALISRIAAIFYQQRVSHLVAADIANKIFQKFLGFQNDDSMVDKSSVIVAMITNKVDRVNHQVLLPIIQCVAAFFLLLTFIIFLVFSLGIQPILVLLGSGLFYAFVYWMIRNYLKKYGKIINRNQTNVVEITQEASQMFRELKVYRLSKLFNEKFRSFNRPLQRANANLRILNNAPRPLIDGFLTITLASYVLYYHSSIGNVLELVPLIAAIALMSARVLPMVQQLFTAAASFRVVMIFCPSWLDI